jgi:hypothetical protein
MNRLQILFLLLLTLGAFVHTPRWAQACPA